MDNLQRTNAARGEGESSCSVNSVPRDNDELSRLREDLRRAREELMVAKRQLELQSSCPSTSNNPIAKEDSDRGTPSRGAHGTGSDGTLQESGSEMHHASASAQGESSGDQSQGEEGVGDHSQRLVTDFLARRPRPGELIEVRLDEVRAKAGCHAHGGAIAK